MQSGSAMQSPSAESPPRPLDSPDSITMEAEVLEAPKESGNFDEEIICIEMDSTKITFRSSSACVGYFEVLSVQSEKKTPVIETGDILREFQGIDMRVDPNKLKQLFNEHGNASGILVFEKKKWGGTLLRLSFKVLTSQLRIEALPAWTDDAPPPRMVSVMARELLGHFKVPVQCDGTTGLSDTSCFSDLEWRTTMLKFARILQDKPLDEARLALCEAMTVLFLHQNKVPPQVQSAISNLEVRTSLAINNISPNAKSDACEHTMVDSNSRQFLPTPTMTKPKTLLELADGDIDLLDETNLSTSAVENSQIEIDSFADADPTIPVLQTSFALKDSPEIQGIKHAPTPSGTLFRIGDMQIPVRFRQNSFNSPADTPRIMSSSKSLQSTPSLLPRMSPINIPASPNELLTSSARKKEDTMTIDAVITDVEIAKSESDGRMAHSANLPSLQESKRDKIASNIAMTPVEVGHHVSPKPKGLPISSKKSTSAAEAADKAARMAHELKALIDTQTQNARFQSVQSAASQQIVAEVEQIKPHQALESAYMHKVEEAAVLRRECANLQEIIATLKLNLSSSVGQFQQKKEEFEEMPSQDGVASNMLNEKKAVDVSTQPASGAITETEPCPMQLHLPSLSLENVHRSTSEEMAFEA